MDTKTYDKIFENFLASQTDENRKKLLEFRERLFPGLDELMTFFNEQSAKLENKKS